MDKAESKDKTYVNFIVQCCIGNGEDGFCFLGVDWLFYGILGLVEIAMDSMRMLDAFPQHAWCVLSEGIGWNLDYDI